jgi:cation transport regulator ChaB
MELLLEDFASKTNKILKDPRFAALHVKAMARSATPQTLPEFLLSTILAFDPTYKLEPGLTVDQIFDPTRKTNADPAYIDYVLGQIYSGNIPLTDHALVRHVLASYRKRVNKKDPNFSPAIDSYKDIKTLIDDVSKIEQEKAVADSENLIEARKILNDNHAHLVLKNNNYEFYRVDTNEDGIQIFKGPQEDITRGKHCAGFWCIKEKHRANYYPLWTAVTKKASLRWRLFLKLAN